MKLTVGKKLGFGFSAILALMVLGGVLNYERASTIREESEAAMNVRFPLIRLCTEMQRDLNQTQSKARQVILSAGQADHREAAKRIYDASWGDIQKDLAAMEEMAPHFTLQANRDRVAELKRQLPVLHEVEEVILARSNNGDRDAIVRAGSEFAEKVTPAADGIRKPLGDMADSAAMLLQKAEDELRSATRSMKVTILLTTLAALALGVFVAVFMSHRISTTTQLVLAHAEAIAAGDLTRNDLEVRDQDELGDLTHAINKVNDSLKKMIVDIAESAQHLASASEELSATSQQISANSDETSTQAGVVSQATQQVSQNLNGLSSGAGEMTTTIQSIASNAHEAPGAPPSAGQPAQAATATTSNSANLPSRSAK